MHTFSDTHIPERLGTTVELWGVRGSEAGGYWPTKIIAESFARALFPREAEDVRYGRIFYVKFLREE